MKRAAGTLLLAVLAAGLMYGYAVSQRERSYADFVQQGDEALARDDSYAAIEAFSVAISLKRDSMAAHLKRGEAYRRQHQYASALRDLRRAAELDPLSPYPRELLGDVHYSMAAAGGDGGTARFVRAMEHYNEAIGLDDRTARVHYKLGLASYRARQFSGAIDALEESIRLDPRFAEAHALLGICLRARQQPREAVRSLERALALSPGLAVAREELAGTYARLGRHEDRLTQLVALVGLQPGPARERTLGLAYARAGQLDQAVAQLGRAARRYPDDPEMFLALGRIWLDQAAAGDRVALNKALQALSSAIRPTSSSRAYTLYGRALLLAGNIVRAEQMFEQAVSRFPVDPDAFLHLSDVAIRIGRRAAARRAIIDHAALVRPESLSLTHLVRLADAQLAAGRSEEARRVLDLALERDPGNAAALSLRQR